MRFIKPTQFLLTLDDPYETNINAHRSEILLFTTDDILPCTELKLHVMIDLNLSKDKSYILVCSDTKLL